MGVRCGEAADFPGLPLVDRLGAFDPVEITRRPGREPGVHQARPGVDVVPGCYRTAVVEAHVPAQGDGVHPAVVGDLGKSGRGVRGRTLVLTGELVERRVQHRRDGFPAVQVPADRRVVGLRLVGPGRDHLAAAPRTGRFARSGGPSRHVGRGARGGGGRGRAASAAVQQYGGGSHCSGAQDQPSGRFVVRSGHGSPLVGPTLRGMTERQERSWCRVWRYCVRWLREGDSSVGGVPAGGGGAAEVGAPGETRVDPGVGESASPTTAADTSCDVPSGTEPTAARPVGSATAACGPSGPQAGAATRRRSRSRRRSVSGGV